MVPIPLRLQGRRCDRASASKAKYGVIFFAIALILRLLAHWPAPRAASRWFMTSATCSFSSAAAQTSCWRRCTEFRCGSFPLRNAEQSGKNLIAGVRKTLSLQQLLLMNLLPTSPVLDRRTHLAALLGIVPRAFSGMRIHPLDVDDDRPARKALLRRRCLSDAPRHRRPSRSKRGTRRWVWLQGAIAARALLPRGSSFCRSRLRCSPRRRWSRYATPSRRTLHVGRNRRCRTEALPVSLELPEDWAEHARQPCISRRPSPQIYSRTRPNAARCGGNRCRK